MKTERYQTGIPGLDEKLGGGLLPGTMTVLVGSSGIGKTQFGLQFLNAGLEQEKKRGIIFDLTARGDSQNHQNYAQRLFQWTPIEENPERRFDPETFFDSNRFCADYFHAFTRKGRRVTRRDLDFDQWQDWKAELTQHLDAAIAFFFAQFVRGTRRFIIDGIEPVEHQSESIQFEFLEYVYRQIIQKESDWVARDLFRQHFREHETTIMRNLYQQQDLCGLILYTSPETSLESMIDKPLDEGDLLATANTVIYLGKVREGVRFRRGMYVAKHRGSVCPDEILWYNIDADGIRLSGETE